MEPVRSRKLLASAQRLDTTYVAGLAVLKSALIGYGLPSEDEALWALTQFDGEEIEPERLVAAGRQSGLLLEAIYQPFDYLWSERNPTPIIVRWQREEDASPYYVLIWSRVGASWQVMDPASGVRWVTTAQLRNRLAREQLLVSADLPTEHLHHAITQRLKKLRIPLPQQEIWLNAIADDPAATIRLDAALRMVNRMAGAGLGKGEAAARAITPLLAPTAHIPAVYWTYLPIEADKWQFQGIQTIQIHGRNPDVAKVATKRALPSFRDALAGTTEQTILQTLREDGSLASLTIVAGLFIAAMGLTVEAFFMQGLMQLGEQLSNTTQRMQMMGAFIGFLVVLLILLMVIDELGRKQGRRLELRLRFNFLEKLPRLPNWFFQRSPISATTQRAYTLRGIRILPDLAQKIVQLAFQILLTAVGLIWLEPSGAWIVVLLVLFTVVWPYFIQPTLMESSVDLADSNTKLSRIYLDTLFGLMPIRVHSAERAIWRRYQEMLVDWVEVNLKYFNFATVVQSIGLLIMTALTSGIVLNYIFRAGELGSLLLLAFWATTVPQLGQQLVDTFQEYVQKRTIVKTVTRPLLIPDATPFAAELSTQWPADASPTGVHIDIKNVSVVVEDQTILSDLTLEIKAGEHLAVVGPSGAGKSSLANLLLGWYTPTEGTIAVNQLPLDGETIELLRRETAWIDQAVQLWNRSLIYNLWYANQANSNQPMGDVIEKSDLFSVLEVLPEGLQTTIGENGRLLSGGQGQRVRMARAMLQDDVRLVIMDEPFRGLDRPKRDLLLARAREFWKDATLICITHDVSQAEGFDRTIVIEDGGIVPTEKAEQRLRELIEAEEAVRRTLWESADWRRIHLAKGVLSELEQTDEEKNDE